MFSGFTAVAQPKKITEGQIKANLEISRDEETDASNMNSQRGFNMDMTLETLIKGDKSVTKVQNEFAPTTIIRDNATGKTTTLMSMMGQKVAMEAEDGKMSARMDSLRLADSVRRANGDNSGPRIRDERKTYTISYASGTKKIAGFECKKAYVVSTNVLGVKDSTMFWYTPEFEMPKLVGNTGGRSFGGRGMRSMGSGLMGTENLQGMVMEFEQKNNNMTTHFVVTKIDPDKKVDDKEFVIPEGYEKRDMSSMFQGGREGTRIQIGN